MKFNIIAINRFLFNLQIFLFEFKSAKKKNFSINFLIKNINCEIIYLFFLAIGVQWSSMFRVSDAPYTAAGSIGVMIIFSILGTALHFFSCIYINIVFPGKFGLKHHPFYLLQVKFYYFFFLQN